MSNLEQIVKNSLEMRQVSPQILSNVGVLLQRSLTRLQNSDVLPPRTLEFTSKDRKQEKRDGDDLLYNFYYLPEDFRKLDEFRPMKNYPYHWESDEHELYRKKDENYSESDLKKLRNKFTIINNNHDQESKYEKILIAFPFPDDDETIQLKYYINGKDLDFDWVPSTHYEAVIADVEKMVGLRQSNDLEAEDHISNAVGQNKEFKGQGSQGRQSLSGSYFGKKSRNILTRNSDNNL